MKPSTKIIELAKKLYALAQRGEGGEKTNAETLLAKVMRDNNISISDIEGEIKKEWAIRYYSNEELKFMHQVIASVIGTVDVYEQYKYGKKQYRAVINVTDAEFIEIIEKHKFFWKLYQEEQKIFYSAFIQAQELYRKESDEERKTRQDNEEELSPEEEERLEKLMRMSGSIEKKSIIKSIGTGK